MSGQGLANVLDKQTWLDPVANPLHDVVETGYEKAGKAGEVVRNVLGGEWFGHPLHPAVTDVPVGAWTAAVAMDGIDAARGGDGLSAGADGALVVGIAGAVVAAITGLSDYSQVENVEVRRMGVVHAASNTLALSLMVGSLVARRRGMRSVGRYLALAGYLAMTAGAYIGGSMVYTHGTGEQSKGSRSRT